MSRRQRRVLTVALAVALAMVIETMVDRDTWSKRTQQLRDLQAIRLENDTSQDRTVFVRRQIKALRELPEVQERVVRDELGYVRPGEMVLTLDE